MADLPEKFLMAILGRRRSREGGRDDEVLIQWAGDLPNEATGKLASDIQTQFSTFVLEDKAVHKGDNSDRPAQV
ncbi:UNVERIFIED_CONTAM: hypothetical protein Slati_4281600 [Sesamum latifolium]|uniref:Uncharacterized protein n=1 Tax=Sesamum latifolium TaxID=2727402 RepID=A0AAW2TDY6_9LAMI